MFVLRVLVHALLFTSSVAQALAGEACDAPVTEWKPRELLQARLEAAGLHVKSITTDNGCYLAIATKSDGEPVALFFDPKTLLAISDLPEPG